MITTPPSIYLGHDDWGNQLWLVCVINRRDPDDSRWFVHTEYIY